MTDIQTAPAADDDILGMIADFDFDTPEDVIVENEPDELAALAELVEEEAAPVAAAAEPVSELDELEDLQLELTKAEIYSGQTVTTPIADAVAAKPKATPSAGAATRAPSAPRIARDLSSLPASVFCLEGDPSTTTDADKAAVIAAMPAQKKVAEKYENVFLSIASGRKVSTYTQTAVDLFKANSVVSRADIIAAYRAAGQGDGTANSQTGQMMALLPALKIASVTARGQLTLNPNSVIFGLLTK